MIEDNGIKNKIVIAVAFVIMMICSLILKAGQGELYINAMGEKMLVYCV